MFKLNNKLGALFILFLFILAVALPRAVPYLFPANPDSKLILLEDDNNRLTFDPLSYHPKQVSPNSVYLFASDAEKEKLFNISLFGTKASFQEAMQSLEQLGVYEAKFLEENLSDFKISFHDYQPFSLLKYLEQQYEVVKGKVSALTSKSSSEKEEGKENQESTELNSVEDNRGAEPQTLPESNKLYSFTFSYDANAPLVTLDSSEEYLASEDEEANPTLEQDGQDNQDNQDNQDPNNLDSDEDKDYDKGALKDSANNLASNSNRKVKLSSKDQDKEHKNSKGELDYNQTSPFEEDDNLKDIDIKVVDSANKDKKAKYEQESEVSQDEVLIKEGKGYLLIANDSVIVILDYQAKGEGNSPTDLKAILNSLTSYKMLGELYE